MKYFILYVCFPSFEIFFHAKLISILFELHIRDERIIRKYFSPCQALCLFTLKKTIQSLMMVASTSIFISLFVGGIQNSHFFPFMVTFSLTQNICGPIASTSSRTLCCSVSAKRDEFCCGKNFESKVRKGRTTRQVLTDPRI